MRVSAPIRVAFPLLAALVMAVAIASPAPAQTTTSVPLDLRIGEGSTLTVRPDRSYRIGVLDLRVVVTGDVDNDIDDLMGTEELAGLDWFGIHLIREEWVPEEGEWLRRRIHADAGWMIVSQSFSVEVIDGNGVPLGPPVVLNAGHGRRRRPADTFTIRRMSAIQTASPCPTPDDCTGALFVQEALLQLRNTDAARSPSFEIPPEADALRITWSLRPSVAFRVPVAFEAAPEFESGFGLGAEFVGEAADGQVDPGDTVTVRLTLTDGTGRRLHPEGSLPTYRDFLEGRSGGIRYFDFEQGVLFFDDKNREGVLLSALAGPLDRIRQIYTELPLEDFLLPNQIVALPERDGYFAEWQLVPPGDVLFGGAFGDPEAWDRPVSDLVRFHLPPNAEPGRYLFVVKARREYLGESALVTTQAEISVGSGSPDGSRWVGGCEECHTDDLDLKAVLHGNGDPRSCNICHAPLGFEPDNLLAFRAHYVHFFSHRYGAAKADCQRCHLTLRSIERQSYLACLGCHLTYHGGAEVHGLYDRCADIVYCHPDHNFPDLEHFDPLPPPGSGREMEEADLLRLHVERGSTVIPYRMSTAGTVRVEIFDVRGRRVARIDDGVVRLSGTHTIRWDGRRSDGEPATSGIYFARIETPTAVIRSRVRLVR